MKDFQLLDAVERYIRGEMDAQEMADFEQIRQSNSDIDHLVIEHTILLSQLNKLGERKHFKDILENVHNNLLETGAITQHPPQAKIIELFKKQKKVWTIAASIAGLTALAISGMVTYLAPQRHAPSEIRQLYNEIKQVKNSQKIQSAEINSLKSSKDIPIAPGKFDGTGFLINGKGYIATSAHLVAKADSVYVVNNKGDYYKVSSLYVNTMTDVAILKIDDNRFQPVKYLPYSIYKNTAELGEPIFTLGFPRSEIVYNQGYLSAKTGYNGDTITCQIAISANPGNSGGPIFNRQGEVIGVLSGKQITAEGVVFSSKSANIVKALEELNNNKLKSDMIKLPEISAVKGLDRVQQIKKIKEYIFMVKSY